MPLVKLTFRWQALQRHSGRQANKSESLRGGTWNRAEDQEAFEKPPRRDPPPVRWARHRPDGAGQAGRLGAPAVPRRAPESQVRCRLPAGGEVDSNLGFPNS